MVLILATAENSYIEMDLAYDHLIMYLFSRHFLKPVIS